ncbi:hypothetical protein ANN_21026 [Periplaneta americana]|uniref:Uncharacterized protein n=1 Tax=Periplaneta americana TaxID=6978 RepID=A0ABQ8SFD5_PERAM|nr:hypothetical protein ANN_21026 [Periplaneta americana]
MDMRKVGYDDRDWINLAQDRDQWGGGLCEDGNEPPGSLKARNELAHHLAKQAASNDELPVSFDRIPVSDIMRELQEECVVKWESKCCFPFVSSGTLQTVQSLHCKEEKDAWEFHGNDTVKPLPALQVPVLDTSKADTTHAPNCLSSGLVLVLLQSKLKVRTGPFSPGFITPVQAGP